MSDKQICSFCVMDTSDPDIVFDEHGVCNHCKKAVKILNYSNAKKMNFQMDEYVNKIKQDGRKQKYDCIVGVSGGVDSSYVVYLVKSMGLRPLAVHFDNGWDSELAVQNIRVLLEKLDVDLYTYVVDWQEFRDLQLSFLKASTPDSEIPTDHMISALLSLVADHYHVKHVIMGDNITSESILPRAWSQGHWDWKYINGIHQQFGTIPLKTYVYRNRMSYFYFNVRIDWFSILNYIEYDKEKAKQFLIDEFGWRDYGGKHYESFYTKFYQSYILPTKFGYDKRRAHYSSLIAAGQLSREQALEKLKEPLLNFEDFDRDVEYFCEKMEISRQEFDTIMNMPSKSYIDYPNYEFDWFGRLLSKVWNVVEKG